MTQRVNHLSEADDNVLKMLETKFSLEADQKHARWMKDPTILQRSNRARLKRLIEQASGDITKALELMVGQEFGGWGYGGDPWVDCMQVAPACPIEIHLGDLVTSHALDEPCEIIPPDYSVTWRVVLEYVAGYPVQARMF